MTPLHLHAALIQVSIIVMVFYLTHRSELSGRCTSPNSSPTAEEERCVQVRNVVIKCAQLWTMAVVQEFVKVKVWEQLQLTCYM